MDSDHNNNHAIAIFNGWIYDANMKHAIPYTREGLDFTTKTAIMDTDTGELVNPTNTRYVGARMAYGFYEVRRKSERNHSMSVLRREECKAANNPPKRLKAPQRHKHASRAWKPTNIRRRQRRQQEREDKAKAEAKKMKAETDTTG